MWHISCTCILYSTVRAMYRRRLVCEGTPPVFVFFIVVAIPRCEPCRLGTAQDRRNGGQTVESDQEKTFVVVSLAITHLTGKDGLC